MSTRLLAVALLSAACSSSHTPPTTPAPTPTTATPAVPAASPCRAAVDHLFAVTSAQEDPKIRDVAAKVFVHRCETDAWSDAIRQCLLGVKASPDADGCEKLLTPAQQQELRNELAQQLEAAGVPSQRESGKSK